MTLSLLVPGDYLPSISTPIGSTNSIEPFTQTALPYRQSTVRDPSTGDRLTLYSIGLPQSEFHTHQSRRLEWCADWVLERVHLCRSLQSSNAVLELKRVLVVDEAASQAEGSTANSRSGFTFHFFSESPQMNVANVLEQQLPIETRIELVKRVWSVLAMIHEQQLTHAGGLGLSDFGCYLLPLNNTIGGSQSIDSVRLLNPFILRHRSKGDPLSLINLTRFMEHYQQDPPSVGHHSAFHFLSSLPKEERDLILDWDVSIETLDSWAAGWMALTVLRCESVSDARALCSKSGDSALAVCDALEELLEIHPSRRSTLKAVSRLITGARTVSDGPQPVSASNWAKERIVESLHQLARKMVVGSIDLSAACLGKEKSDVLTLRADDANSAKATLTLCELQTVTLDLSQAWDGEIVFPLNLSVIVQKVVHSSHFLRIDCTLNEEGNRRLMADGPLQLRAETSDSNATTVLRWSGESHANRASLIVSVSQSSLDNDGVSPPTSTYVRVLRAK